LELHYLSFLYLYNMKSLSYFRTVTKLARQTQMLRHDPACAAVLGWVENFISPELDESQVVRLTRSAARTGEFHIGALLIRRAAFLRVGWLDASLRHGEFIDWWARAAQLPLAYTVLPDWVLRRRLHADNLTRREQEGRRDYLVLLRQHLARQRETAGIRTEMP